MRIGLGEDRVQRSEHFSAKWKLAVREWGKIRLHVAHRAKAFLRKFLRSSETSASACFREPVCSVMLFWPVDTSSWATTKRDTLKGGFWGGGRVFQTAYIKCLPFLLLPSVLSVLWVCLKSAGYSINKAPRYGLWSPCIYHIVTAMKPKV